MSVTIRSTGNENDWAAFEAIFGPTDGFESELALPRRWDGKDIYGDLNKLLTDYLKKVERIIPKLKKKTGDVCCSVREMLRLYLHGYPSDAYSIMMRLMEELDRDPLYVSIESIENLYRMSSVPENIDDKLRIFHAPYNIRPKIKTYRYSIAGYPSLYLADSLALAEEEMHLFRDKKPAIAARFEFREVFAEWNPTKILEFGFRPQDLAAGREAEPDNALSPKAAGREEANHFSAEAFRKKFTESVQKADKIKEEYSKKRETSNAVNPEENSALPAQDRYIVWYPLIAACSYVRTNREDPFAPEYVVPQLLAQWMRSESTGELIGIKYFSCYSRHASEVGCNYVFPTSGDPLILKDGVRPYCPVLNEAFRFTHTEYLPEYEGVGVAKLEKALLRKKAERALGLTRKNYENETKAELPAELMYLAARSFASCTVLENIYNMENVVSIGDEAFLGCAKLALTMLPEGLTSIGNEAFSGCEKLALTMLPEGLTSIGDGAFDGCANLALTKLPDRLTSISAWAFDGCEKLALTKLPEELTSIGRAAFRKCAELALTKLPEGLANIGAMAFDGCKKLALMKLPDGLTSLGDWAFSNCTSLSNITLPASLTRIGEKVFWGSDNLLNIHFSGTKEQWKNIYRLKEWDAGIPDDCKFHFADGTIMTKKEIHTLGNCHDPEEEQNS